MRRHKTAGPQVRFLPLRSPAMAILLRETSSLILVVKTNLAAVAENSSFHQVHFTDAGKLPRSSCKPTGSSRNVHRITHDRKKRLRYRNSRCRIKVDCVSRFRYRVMLDVK